VRLQNGTDALTSVPDRKISNGFTFSVLPAEGGAKLLELSKA
jgi:hypothetical protein